MKDINPYLLINKNIKNKELRKLLITKDNKETSIRYFSFKAFKDELLEHNAKVEEIEEFYIELLKQEEYKDNFKLLCKPHGLSYRNTFYGEVHNFLKKYKKDPSLLDLEAEFGL